MVALLSTQAAEVYIDSAWHNFSQLVYWCSTHTILTVFGFNITFLNLPMGILIFFLISFVIDQIFFN